MSIKFNNTIQCTNFFEQAILRTVSYWQEHNAIQQIDVPVLDRERETVLNIISRGLEFDPAWPILKQLLIAFAPYMERRGHWEAWRDVMEKAIAAAHQMHDVDGEITLTAFLARLSQRQSRGPDVVRLYARVIRLAKQTGNRFEEARACSNLGYLYIDAGHWWRSEVLSCHALAVFEELRSEHGLAHTYNHLGLLHTRQQRWGDAEKNLERACQIWEVNQDTHSLIHGFTNLGALYVEMNHADQALKYLTDASQIAQLTGELSNVPRIWNNVAHAYRLKMDWLKAEEYAKQAEDIFKKYSDFQGLAQVKQNLGLIFSNSGNRALAVQYFEEALHMHKKLNNFSAVAGVMDDIKKLDSSVEG